MFIPTWFVLERLLVGLVGAFAGKEEIMNMVAPLGPVYQAGTLSGNPIAMSCGYTLRELNENPIIFNALEEKTEYLSKGK